MQSVFNSLEVLACNNFHESPFLTTDPVSEFENSIHALLKFFAPPANFLQDLLFNIALTSLCGIPFAYSGELNISFIL